MAVQVPMTRPPGYGAQLGDTLMKGSAARGEAVGAELDARAKALGDILGNIKGIAEVGGGAIAPDLLIDRFAGGETPIFGNEYAGMADRLRLATMSRTASGGGGGGSGSGGGADGLKSGEMLLRDPNGVVTVAKTSEMDETFRAQLLNGSSGYEVVQMGPVYTGPIAGAQPADIITPEEQAWIDKLNGGGGG